VQSPEQRDDRMKESREEQADRNEPMRRRRLKHGTTIAASE